MVDDLDRIFRIKQEDEYYELKEVRAGGPQGNILGPILYLLHTRDFPQTKNNSRHIHDIVMITAGPNVEVSTNEL